MLELDHLILTEILYNKESPILTTSWVLNLYIVGVM